ncbi:methyl-accepting chemotaxis protein [Alsobacter soli]|uniref:Methyl-accepting chemotaxis protein n=1 Tax=Alsobacter soli TaxID=2109933 RepID=A0A2T1HTW8_9HYPH|nr:methyl-accepting chemotaxis protein [Alsobacter soli]
MDTIHPLAVLRRRTGLLLAGALVLNLPLLLMVGWWHGTLGWAVELPMAALALAAAAVARRGDELGPRLLIGLSVVALVAAMVARAAGPWQGDGHIYFFSGFAVLAAFACPITVAAAGAAAALYYVVGALLAPAYLFPAGEGLAIKVLIHAGVALGEAAILIWLTLTLKSLFGRADALLQESVAAATETATTLSAVDNSPAMLMITDPDGVVRFVSRALVAYLERLAPDLRAGDPGFSLERMVGQRASALLDNPRFRRISDARQDRPTDYACGSYRVDVRATPIRVDGALTGHMLEWRDVTAELAAQKEVAALAAATASGDFSSRIALEGKTGFLLDLAKAMNETSEVVDTATRELAEALVALSRGDLTRRIETHQRGRLEELKDAFNQTVDHLAASVATIQSTAVDVSTAATQIKSGADDLARRTEEQATDLARTAATCETLTGSVRESADASRRAAALANEAMKVADDGGAIVNDAVSAMARIEEASARISDITTVIDEIAFQTNLLALNAAVEAARAGEAGKGFAVVAAEVRTLAQRSSNAAKDITGLIASSGAQITEGVRLVRSTGDALGRIVAASHKVSATVQEISEAAARQSRGIEEMGAAVAHVDGSTEQNAALAEQSAAASETLASLIGALNQLVATFRTSTSAPRAFASRWAA